MYIVSDDGPLMTDYLAPEKGPIKQIKDSLGKISIAFFHGRIKKKLGKRKWRNYLLDISIQKNGDIKNFFVCVETLEGKKIGTISTPICNEE